MTHATKSDEGLLRCMCHECKCELDFRDAFRSGRVPQPESHEIGTNYKPFAQRERNAALAGTTADLQVAALQASLLRSRYTDDYEDDPDCPIQQSLKESNIHE